MVSVVDNTSDDDTDVSDDNTWTIIDDGGIDIPSNDDSDDDSNDDTNDDTDVSDDDSDDGSNDTGKNKKQCNNGGGNGSEGCSPAKSENANNDENATPPKEDKSNKPQQSSLFLSPIVAMTVKFFSRGKVYKFRNVHSFLSNEDDKTTWLFYYKYAGYEEDGKSVFTLECTYTNKNMKVTDVFTQTDLYIHGKQLQDFSKPYSG